MKFPPGDPQRSASFSGKYQESQMKCTEAYRIIQEQKELITQLEADVLNIRGLPSSLYRGEGVGAPTPSPDAEAVTKALQGYDKDFGKTQWFILDQ